MPVDRTRLIGAWRMERWSTQYEDGRQIYPMGEDASGFLLYTPDGYMSAALGRGGRAAFTTGEHLTAAAEEKIRAWDSYFSYCGTFTVDGDRVIHRVQSSSYPNWVGQVQERTVRFEGDHLHLLTPPQRTRRGLQTSTVVWRRAVAAL